MGNAYFPSISRSRVESVVHMGGQLRARRNSGGVSIVCWKKSPLWCAKGPDICLVIKLTLLNQLVMRKKGGGYSINKTIIETYAKSIKIEI